jgi:hypothetical protein
MPSTADFTAHHDRKVNGQRHYKTSSLVEAVSQRPVYKTFWRIGTEYAPAFCLKVTYHA